MTARRRLDLKKLARKQRESHIGVEISVEDAMYWLDLAEEKGYTNRGISDIAVARLVNEIQHGRWCENGQPLIFRDKDGVPLDGHHRLWAIVEAGTTVKADLVLGVPDNVVVTMDTGGKGQRKLDDYLKMHGVANCKNVSGAVQMYAQYRKGNLKANIALHMHEYVEFYKKNKGIEGSVSTCLPLRRVFGYVSAAGFAHFVLKKINESLANDMMLRLASGAGLTNGNAVLALRERLVRQRVLENKQTGSREAHLRRGELAYLFFTAWNKLVTGADVRQIQLPRRDVTWEIPKPKEA
jgi:hypothetical protein